MHFFVVVCVLLTASRADEGFQDPVLRKSVSGKAFYLKPENVGPVQLFDSIYKVVMEYSTPNWARPINLIGYTCTGDDYDNDGWSCPVLWYWLTEIRDKLQEEIYIDSMKVPDTSSFNIDVDCNNFHQVFDGLYLNDAERRNFQSFLTSPENCFGAQTLAVGRNNKYIANNIDSPYRTMREKFFTEYYEHQTPVNRSNDAMYLNARYNYYSSGLFEYYIESRRWTNALASCKDGRIPDSLLSPSDLKTLLALVKTNAATAGFDLVIDDSTQISQYYKEKLVDCAFTTDSLMISLQVPVIASGGTRQGQFLSFLPVPYYNADGLVCSTDVGKGETFVPIPSRDIIVLNSHSRLKCHNNFCQVPQEAEFVGLQTKSCAESLFYQQEDVPLCSEVCGREDNFKLPMISRITDDKVLVFGVGLGQSMDVVCPSKNATEKLENIIPGKDSFELVLPCGCEIQKNGRLVFRVQRRCKDEIIVNPII